MSLRGWWVGHYDLGGVFVVAEKATKARKIGADEMGVEYTSIYALRVPALDGGESEGVVEWEEAKRRGAVIVCEKCGEEFARTARLAKRQMCSECKEAREWEEMDHGRA